MQKRLNVGYTDKAKYKTENTVASINNNQMKITYKINFPKLF